MIQANILGVEQKMDFGTKVIRNYVLLEIGGKKIHAEVPDIGELADLINAGMEGGFQADEAVDERPVTQDMYESALTEAQEMLAKEKAAAAQRNMAAAVSALAKPGDAIQAAMPPAPEPPSEADTPVDWQKLPDEILPPELKTAFRMMEVPAVLPASKVDEIAQSVDAEFTEEDWANVRASMAGAEPQWTASGTPVLEPDPPLVPAEPAPVAQPAPAPQPQQPPVGEVMWTNGMVLKQPRPARTVQKDEYGYPIVPNAGVDPSSLVGDSDVVDEDGIGQA